MKKLLLITMMLGLLISSGCDDWFKEKDHLLIDQPNFRITEDIDTAIGTINTNTKEIDSKTDSISTSAQDIYITAVSIPPDLSEESKAKVEPKIESIKEDSKSIIEDTKEIIKATASIKATKEMLSGTKEKVKDTDDVLKDLVKERNALTKKLKKAEEARDSALHNALRWLIVASIVGAGALGIFGLMYSSKMCLALSAACIVVMSVAIFVETFFIYLVIFGGLILLGLVGALIWNIFVQKRAFKEVVNTVEVAQDNMSEETKDILFGGKDRTGIMDSIQSPETMKMVKREKAKIGNLWLYAKNKEEDLGEEDNKPT